MSLAFGIDLRVSAGAYLARVLWLQGFADQAVRTAEMSIAEAQATGHALSLCWALALAACPIALWTGNLAATSRYTQMLLDNPAGMALPFGVRFVLDFKKLSFSGVAISTRDRSARKRASTRAASRNRVFES